MIFQDKKCIFLHSGKTGGMSVEKLLGHTELCNHTENYDIFYGLSSDGYFLQHATAKVIKELKPEVWKEYFKFTVVRNPYSRIHSTYWYRVNHFKKIGFKSFEQYVMQGLPFLFDKARHNLLYGIHQTPQYHYAYVNDKLEINHVAKFENLKGEMAFISDKFNLIESLPFINHIPNQNRPKKSIGEIFTQEMCNIIQKYYAKDFEFFNYDPNDLEITI